MNSFRLFIAVAATVLLSFAVAAQAVNVTPAKGQSPEQMQKDIAECQGLATQSTGYSPTTAQPSNSAAATPKGGRLRGATTGAVAGAAAAEVRGNRNEEVGYIRLSQTAKCMEFRWLLGNEVFSV